LQETPIATPTLCPRLDICAQAHSADRLADLIEELGFRRRFRRTPGSAALESISVQWIYLGAFHVVSSRSDCIQFKVPGSKFNDIMMVSAVPIAQRSRNAGSQQP
jgi:hypothetical protein